MALGDGHEPPDFGTVAARGNARGSTGAAAEAPVVTELLRLRQVAYAAYITGPASGTRPEGAGCGGASSISVVS